MLQAFYKGAEYLQTCCSLFQIERAKMISVLSGEPLLDSKALNAGTRPAQNDKLTTSQEIIFMNTKLNREYERFRGGAAKPSSTQLHVTLSDRGTIYLNRNAHRLLGKPVAVHIYYNRIKDELAVEPTSLRMPDAFPLKTSSARGYHIHASPVTRHFGIELDGTNKFVSPDIDEHGILHLKLSDTVQTARVRKRKRG
jgi:hypothetical protein